MNNCCVISPIFLKHLKRHIHTSRATTDQINDATQIELGETGKLMGFLTESWRRGCSEVVHIPYVTEEDYTATVNYVTRCCGTTC